VRLCNIIESFVKRQAIFTQMFYPRCSFKSYQINIRADCFAKFLLHQMSGFCQNHDSK